MLQIARIALVVRDYDEAIAWFMEKLAFALIQDTNLAGGERYVLLTPRGVGVQLLLTKAAGPEQETRIGNQTGGAVFLTLETADLLHDVLAFVASGVVFLRPPMAGVAEFADLYGNRWNLTERRSDR